MISCGSSPAAAGMGRYGQGCDGGFGYLVSKWAQDFTIASEPCFPYESGPISVLPCWYRLVALGRRLPSTIALVSRRLAARPDLDVCLFACAAWPLLFRALEHLRPQLLQEVRGSGKQVPGHQHTLRWRVPASLRQRCHQAGGGGWGRLKTCKLHAAHTQPRPLGRYYGNCSEAEMMREVRPRL